ncbi:hypothetical protein ABIA39_006223 [Nocardia sp. GAS34]|uniref:hypothetical protein n=1 Tax=unclassified Nocardia TaxID=2637762 RepID=UPI003D205CFB
MGTHMFGVASAFPETAMNIFTTPASIAGSHVPAHHSATPTSAHRRPPCAEVPNDWDLDVGTPDSWRTAVMTCQRCPLFAQCEDMAKGLIERGLGPRAMIWAGVAYDGAGRVVENLDRHRVAALDHKRPLRIIRNGERPQTSESAPAVPRRRLVLGRRVRPTAAAV